MCVCFVVLVFFFGGGEGVNRRAGKGSLGWGMKVSWYFEPSQQQRIISGLKTYFSMSPSYSAHKSSNQKSLKSDTDSYKTSQKVKAVETEKAQVGQDGMARA